MMKYFRTKKTKYYRIKHVELRLQAAEGKISSIVAEEWGVHRRLQKVPSPSEMKTRYFPKKTYHGIRDNGTNQVY